MFVVLKKIITSIEFYLVQIFNFFFWCILFVVSICLNDFGFGNPFFAKFSFPYLHFLGEFGRHNSLGTLAVVLPPILFGVLMGVSLVLRSRFLLFLILFTHLCAAFVATAFL